MINYDLIMTNYDWFRCAILQKSFSQCTREHRVNSQIIIFDLNHNLTPKHSLFQTDYHFVAIGCSRIKTLTVE